MKPIQPLIPAWLCRVIMAAMTAALFGMIAIALHDLDKSLALAAV